MRRIWAQPTAVRAPQAPDSGGLNADAHVQTL